MACDVALLKFDRPRSGSLLTVILASFRGANSQLACVAATVCDFLESTGDADIRNDVVRGLVCAASGPQDCLRLKDSTKVGSGTVNPNSPGAAIGRDLDFAVAFGDIAACPFRGP